MVFAAGHPVLLPGQAVDFVDLAPHPVEPLPGLLDLPGSDAEVAGQLADFVVQGVGGAVVGIGKGDGGDALQAQHLHQGLGVGAVPLGDGDDLADAMAQGGSVEPLDPAADVAGEAGRFGLLDEALGLGVGDEDVVEVDRAPAGGDQDLQGNGCGESDHSVYC